MDFESLAAGRIIPPWTPTVVGSMDTSQFDLEFTSMLPVGESLFFSFLCMRASFTPAFTFSSSCFLSLFLLLLHSFSPHSHSTSSIISLFWPLPTILEIRYSLSNKCHHNFFTPYFILVQCPLTYVTRTSDPWTKHSWDSPSLMTLHHWTTTKWWCQGL